MPKTKQLIILAGVSSVGKSHLFKHLEDNENILLREELGLSDLAAWAFWDAGRLVSPAGGDIHSGEGEFIKLKSLIQDSEPQIEKLIVLYDLFAHAEQAGEFRLLSELLKSAASTRVITCTASRFALFKRAHTKLFRAYVTVWNQRFHLLPKQKKIRLGQKTLRLVRKAFLYLFGKGDRIHQRLLAKLQGISLDQHWILDCTLRPRLEKATPQADRGPT